MTRRERRERRVRPGEIAIAAIAICVVAMLIVPLPRPLLDVLLVLNIAIAVSLLMASVFSPRPLRFTSFPTLLVITTLFRVGLEVSVTRLILADADAGEVVAAFGGSVVAESLIVGLVVFAVITIVQLIVVARGAERVAEVAARFALDAMPGKQMAIDAELRAGTLDAEGARRRRTDLERESQLYGAMDGAMRFVKGDAIAAIAIVVINLVGGLAVGVGVHGMSASDAIHTYSLLSIGEGLVAQIPALLVAVASGLLVTRVATAPGADAPIGDDLPEQLGPRALVGAAILLAGLGLVPGLPLAPFVLLAALAAGAAWLAMRARTAAAATRSDLAEPGAADVRGPRPSLRLSGDLVATARDPDRLRRTLATARRDATRVLGFPIPPLDVVMDRSLGEHEAALAIDATPVAWFDVAGGELEPLDESLTAALIAAAPDLLGLDRVSELVDRAAVHAPVTVREVVPKRIGLPALGELLRALVRERVPIDDIAAILEAIALLPDRDLAGPPTVLVDRVRAHLRRQISARWAPRGQLSVFTVDAMIEDAVRTAIDRRDGTPVLALEPAIAHDIVTAVRDKLATATDGVILASGDIRHYLSELLQPELPGVAVLAAHELVPDTTVHTAGRIEV